MPMQTGDLVTTPAWTWHDHYNESSQPVIWLDVLDVRLVAIGKMIQEPFSQPQQPRTRESGFSSKTMGHVKASWLKSEHPTPPYRYAWAERARSAGYPERFAQEALGHKSKAVHAAYARKARVEIPSLEEYEKLHGERKAIPLQVQNGIATAMPPAANEAAPQPQTTQMREAV